MPRSSMRCAWPASWPRCHQSQASSLTKELASSGDEYLHDTSRRSHARTDPTAQVSRTVLMVNRCPSWLPGSIVHPRTSFRVTRASDSLSFRSPSSLNWVSSFVSTHSTASPITPSSSARSRKPRRGAWRGAQTGSSARQAPTRRATRGDDQDRASGSTATRFGRSHVPSGRSTVLRPWLRSRCSPS